MPNSIEGSAISRAEAGGQSGPEAGQGKYYFADAAEAATVWLLIGIIAWSQFPLGSVLLWSTSLLVLLVMAAWLVWLPAGLIHIRSTQVAARRAAPALILMAAVLA